MTLLPLALVSLLAAHSAAAAGWDCKSPLTLGKQSFDLSSLAGEHHFEVLTPTPPTITKTTYRLSLCSPLPTLPNTPAADQCSSSTNLCMTTISTRSGLEDRIISVVPVVQDLGEKTPALEWTGEEGGAWWFSVGGGAYNEVEQRVRIEMVCDAGAKETVPTYTSYDPPAGLLSLKWQTAAACSTAEGAPSPPPPKDDDKQKDGEGEGEQNPRAEGGLGFFGWFFALIFIFLVTYLLLGSYHNYTQYGATGWDAIPHKDLWRDLPWVLGDLFKGRGGSRSGYSALG